MSSSLYKKQPGGNKFSRREFIRLLAGLTGSAAAFSLAGCGSTPVPTAAPAESGASTAANATPEPTSAAAAVTLRLWTPAGVRFGKPNEALVEEYQRTHPNVKVELTTTPIGDYFPKLATEIGAGTANVDIFHSIPTFVVAFASGNKILNLEELVPADYIADLVSDIPPEYLDTFRYEGALYGLPNDSNAQWSFYRTDLFEEAGLEPAKKWEDVATIAKALTKGDVFGYTASLRRGEYAGAHFSTIFWSYGGEWWDEGFNPTLDNEIGRQTLEIMLELMDYADPGSINATEDDTISAMASGVAAYAPALWGNSALTNPELSQFAEQMGTAVCPMGGDQMARPILGGLAYMIPSWTEHKQEAAEFIQFAASRDIMQLFVKNTGQPARISALNDPANVEFAPYFPILSQSLKQGHAQVRVAESFQLLDFLGNEVALVLTKDKSIDQSLADIQTGFSDILKQGGHLK